MIEVFDYEHINKFEVKFYYALKFTDKLKLKDYIVEQDHLNFDGYKILKYYKYKQKGVNDDEV